MLTLIIAISAGVIAGLLSALDLNIYWSIANGFIVFVIVQLLIGLLVRKKVNAINNHIQDLMTRAQNKINRKIQVFQHRPGGNAKSVQKMLEKEQAEAVREALRESKAMEPLFKWNLLLKKQINTMRMMFYYQIREFAKVDALLSDCLMLDSRAVAFKLARMYKKNDPGIEKFFKKKARRAKGNDCALLYGAYSWMLVQRGEIDRALELLTQARKKTDHQTIVDNREKLANGKIKLFSNAGLGEMWYALYLEEPKIKQQRVRQRF